MNDEFVAAMSFQEAERHHVVEHLVDLLSHRAATYNLYKFTPREYKIPIIAAAPGLGKTRLLVELPRLLASALQRESYCRIGVHPDIRCKPVQSLAVSFNFGMLSRALPNNQALAGRVAFLCKQIIGQPHGIRSSSLRAYEQISSWTCAKKSRIGIALNHRVLPYSSYALTS